MKMKTYRIEEKVIMFLKLYKESKLKIDIKMVDRTGESNIASNGQTMTIIEYRKYNDIDIQFEDGTIVRNKSYDYFKKGNIRNPIYIQNRIGETNITNNGQTMTIIGYRKYTDIDVQFEDGTIVKNKSYSCFKKGEIKNPNYVISGISYNELFCFEQLEQFGFKKSEKGELKHLGLSRFELDLYNPELKIGIEYDGGAYNKTKKHHTIQKDIKKDLLCEKVGITLYRIREPQLPKYNSSSIKYYLEDNSKGSQNLINVISLIVKDINSKFNTKFKYKYKKKEIKLEKIQSKIKRKRVGETNIITNGQTMTIIEYRDCNNIDIQFEDGTIVRNKSYGNFKKGKIKNPNSKIGETSTTNNGQIMTVIRYKNALNIDIQFEDDTIVRNKSYDCFKKGMIKNPNYTQNRVGESNIANNGQTMTIIEYRKYKDIDIQFEDGTIVKHKSYDNFKLGSIKNPNYVN